MGFKYAGETGMFAGFLWATTCNFQRSLSWYRRPWTHVAGMVVCYYGLRQATKWEDMALQLTIDRYERRGFVIPEDRKKLFEPQEYS